MDFGDVIVHVFHHEKRDVYALEQLWSDAPRIGINGEAVEPAPVDGDGADSDAA